MIAHQLDAAGVIINTIMVDSLDFMPGLADADLGGAIGDTYDAETGLFTPPTGPDYDIADDKFALNAEINAWREAINYTTFPHAGKLIACDTLSRSDIDAVANNIALFGAFPASFPGAWKATDNSYIVQPTVDDFKAMFADMTAQGAANFNQAQTWKVQAAEATTQAEIDAIRAAL